MSIRERTAARACLDIWYERQANVFRWKTTIVVAWVVALVPWSAGFVGIAIAYLIAWVGIAPIVWAGVEYQVEQAEADYWEAIGALNRGNLDDQDCAGLLVRMSGRRSTELRR